MFHLKIENLELFVKGTLIQISKFHYVFGFIEKKYPENFAFIILRNLELCTR